MKRILIIGGGASGQAAAIAAAEAGADVTILEHTAVLGKKILATGNGRCNFSNTAMSAVYYRSENEIFAEQILSQFTPQDSISLFERMGVLTDNKGGYLYPYTNQAVTIADSLRRKIRELGIRVCVNTEVTGIVQTAKGFVVSGIEKIPEESPSGKKTAGKKEKRPVFTGKVKKISLNSDRIILACGSQAAPKTGSDGSGYDLARMLGHRIVPVYPALVQLRCEGSFLKGWSGIRCRGSIRLFADGRELACDTGELQLTDYGVSGIPVFQVSRYASIAIGMGQKVEAELNFFPDYSGKEVCTFLHRASEGREDSGVRECLSGMLSDKLIPVILQRAGVHADERMNEAVEQRLCEVMTAFHLKVTGTNSFEQAQVCAGGVDTAEVTGQCESKKTKGIYIVGELLDVDGICGGYNLHFAWATGTIAGRAAAND